MSAYFRIRWRDRLGAFLLGRVPEVSTDTAPGLVEEYHGGNAFSLCYDAIGHYEGSAPHQVPFWAQPTLRLITDDKVSKVACPCCGLAVNVARIHRPNPWWMRFALQRKRAAKGAT